MADARPVKEPFQHDGRWYARDANGDVRPCLSPLERAKRDHKQLAAMVSVEMNNNGVPSRFIDASLDELGEVVEGYQRAADRLEAMIDTPALYALCGTRGGGKTHLACATMRRFFECGKQAKYMRAMDVFLKIKSSFGNSGLTQEEIVTKLSRLPLLILDELQVRSDSAWEDSILIDLIDRRYSEKRSTILISNLTPEAFCTRLGDSVTSRLQEAGGIIKCEWPSRRA